MVGYNKKLEKAYKTRNRYWEEVKEEFLEEAINRLIKEARGENGIVFHSLYLKLTHLSDEEIYDFLMKELEE